MKTISKIRWRWPQKCPSPQKKSPPPSLKRILPEMFYYLDCGGAPDIKLEMLLGVQTGNWIQHDEYNVSGIKHMHAYRKYNYWKPFALSNCWRWNYLTTFTLTKHTRHWTYPALRYFYIFFFYFTYKYLF